MRTSPKLTIRTWSNHANFTKPHHSSLPRLANFSFAQQSDRIQSCELHQGSHSHLVQSCELHQTSSFKPAPPCDKNGHPPTTSIPTRSPHIVVIKNDPGVPDRPLWPTVGDTTAKRPYHPQPPFQHAAHTLLSSKTTQAFPTGHSGRQPVTSPANRPYRLNLHSDTQPTPSCHQKRLRRARSATLADSR